MDIEKFTNGVDADSPPGPSLVIAGTVTWTYVVTNTNGRPLTDIAVADDQGVTVTCPKNSLDGGESMTCTATGVVAPGQYANIGTVTALTENEIEVTGSDPSHYFGSTGEILIEKATNGQDADTPPGPTLTVGDPVTWTYVLTNNSNGTLVQIVVTDDQGVAVSCPATQLGPGESMTCTAGGVVTPGQYANVGTVTAETLAGDQLLHSDPSHYFGEQPSLRLEKSTQGEDADSPPGPFIPVGAPVNWTYVVTNEGTESMDQIVVTDDQGVTVTCSGTVLAAGASMTCTASDVAAPGQYANVGTVIGRDATGRQVSASDPSHYFGQASLVEIPTLATTRLALLALLILGSGLLRVRLR